MLMTYLGLKIIVVIFFIKKILVHKSGRNEVVQISAFFLGGSSGTFGAIDESADFTHFEQFVLFWRCDVL